MVTNPATRDWTVTASLFATLNDMFGNRTICGIGRGDSAVRVTNGTPVTLATLRESIEVIRALGNSEQASTRATCCVPVVAAARGCRSGSPPTGPKALALTGEVGRRVHPAARRSRTSPRGRSPRCARRPPTPGRDPASITICVAAPAYVTDGTDAGARARARPVPLVRRHGRQPRRRHRRALRRRRRRRSRRRCRDYIAGRAGLRLQLARQGRQHAHRLRARTRSSTGSA